MKNIFIAILVIVVIVLGYLQSKSKVDINDVSPSESTEQVGMKLYNSSKFNFYYPEGYTLTETSDGVTITSVPLPQVNTAECLELAEEARADCLKPQNQLSPNITIKFMAGNANALWETSLFGDSYPEEYKKSVYDQVEETSLGNPPQTYKYYYTGGEFGGHGKYGRFLNNGLLLATYSHKDMEGGYQFTYMKSNTYQLDRHQQKELLEQILTSIVIK